MLAKQFVSSQRSVLIQATTVRSFSFEHRELQALQLKFNRQMNLMKMMTHDKEFNYEPPKMSYDKKTGDVKIFEPSKAKKKRIIRNLDDLQKEKEKLFKQVGLDEEQKASIESGELTGDVESLGKRLAEFQATLGDQYDVDASNIPVFSRDFMRIDIGLVIQRPPIFMQLRQREMDFLQLRSRIMNEYFCNSKQYIEEIEEVSKLNEDILADHAQASPMNLDNFPTHRDANGNTYCGASKHFSKADPACDDPRSLHYAGEDRVYLLLKNKYTGKWEFPTGKIYIGQSFLRAKQNLFVEYSNNDWKVKFYGSVPLVHTIRDMTEVEKNDKLNYGYKGVRTYFFGAHHWRGLPVFDYENTDHEDHAWVPKRQLNEYFDEEYHKIFIDATFTR